MRRDTMSKTTNTTEVLEAIGHENEKEGVKWTQYFMNEWDQKQRGKDHENLNLLDKRRKFTRQRYHEVLSGMINEGLSELDVEHGFKAHSEFNKSGVVVRVTDPDGKKYARAFKPSGEPEIDFNAVVGLLSQVLDTSDTYYVSKKKSLESRGFVL